MTDKQIIIDGVDVSGCYELFNGCCCDNGSFYCSDQPNCKFKLEKRGYKIEQITEFTPRKELIETITHLRVLNAELESYNEQLKESQNIEIKENKILREELKAKEQECEFSNLRIIQLQETLSQYETDLSTKDCIVETCKAQYKELKSENDNIKETFDGLFKVQYKLADNNKKLRQWLTEIKEIAKVEIECKTYEIEHDCFNETRCKALNEHIDFTEQILQKISEVEDDR